MRNCFVYIASLYILAGCVTADPPVIITEGNTFSSSNNPAIQIELNEDFKYLGSFDKRLKQWSAKKNSHLYAQLSNEKYLEKIIRISILERPAGWNWSHITWNSIYNLLKDSTIKLKGENYKFLIKAQETANGQTDQYLLKKGITTPRCYMWMCLGRVFGKTKIHISIYEDISNYKEFGINSCADWNDKNMLNDKQTKYLKEFENRAISSIKIL